MLNFKNTTIFFFTMLIYIIAIFSYAKSQDEEYVGMKAAIKLSLMKKLKQHFFTDIIKHIERIKIDNQSFKFGFGITNLFIKIENIKLEMHLLRSDNIEIVFVGPDLINIRGSNMNVRGSLRINIEFGILPVYNTNVRITSRKLDIDADIKVGWAIHQNFKNKKIFHFEIARLNFDIDFDYTIDGAVTNLITYFFDHLIKSAIKDYSKSTINSLLLPIINNEIEKLFNQGPIYIPLFNNTLIDYSLLEPPRLHNDLLIINIKAFFLQKNQIYDIGDYPNIGLTKLPSIIKFEKSIKLHLSPNTINTLMRLLFHSNLLKYNYHIDNIVDVVPEKRGFLNNFHPANLIRNMLGYKFGYNTKGRIDFKLLEIPNIIFDKNTYSSNIKLFLAFLIEQKNGEMKSFVIFEVATLIVASGVITENLKFDFKIKKFLVKSFKTITNHLGLLLTNQIIQFWINYEFANFVEFFNNKYLKGIKLGLPVIAGMNFNNSKITIFDKYIEVEINILFIQRKNKVKRFLKRYLNLN